MKIRSILFILVAVFFGTTAFAQKTLDTKKDKKKKSSFSIDLDHKTRFESSPSIGGRNAMVALKDTVPGSKTIQQRARLIMTYNASKIQAKFSIQDVRYFGQAKYGASGKIWGSDLGSTLGIHEAWAKYLFVNNNKKQFGIKIGRQELNYDSRLLGFKNWLLQAAAYDAITLECDNKEFGVKWQAGLAYNSVDLIGTATPFRTLGYFFLDKKIGKIANIKFSNLYEGMEQDTEFKNGKQDSTYFRNTVGFNPIVKVAGIKFNGEFYYQFGGGKALAENKVQSNAGMLMAANLSYKIKLGEKKFINAGVGFEQFSGRAYNDTIDPTVDKVFASPYANLHKYFGCSDMHLVLLKDGRGLQDINVKIKIANVLPKTAIMLDFYNIYYATTQAYANNDSENVEFKDIGNVANFMVYYKLAKKTTFKVGYSLFMPSQNYLASKFGYDTNGNINQEKMHNFIWVMFSFQPNLFKYTK